MNRSQKTSEYLLTSTGLGPALVQGNQTRVFHLQQALPHRSPLPRCPAEDSNPAGAYKRRARGASSPAVALAESPAERSAGYYNLQEIQTDEHRSILPRALCSGDYYSWRSGLVASLSEEPVQWRLDFCSDEALQLVATRRLLVLGKACSVVTVSWRCLSSVYLGHPGALPANVVVFRCCRSFGKA